MKVLLRNLVEFFWNGIIFCLAHTTRIKKNSILILESSYPSGSNTRILLEGLEKEYNVTYMDLNRVKFPIKSLSTLVVRLKAERSIAKFHLIISTHGIKKLKKKQILIDLWHGIPLKAMSHMETSPNYHSLNNFNMDYLITSSKFSSTLLNACMHVDFTKHEILGQPRNDYFYKSNLNLEKIIPSASEFNKRILYMPTYREGFAGRVEGSTNNDLFKFEDEERTEEFFKYLKEKKYLLIVKLHPMEEQIVREKYKKYLDDLFLLTTSQLLDAHLDLYEIMNDVDLLITDYSSVYFDYLLLDRPIIFTNADIELYKEARGFVLEPYDEWSPGYKAQSYNSLINALELSFTEDGYKKERAKLTKIFHLFQDGNSTKRIQELIVKKLSEANK